MNRERIAVIVVFLLLTGLMAALVYLFNLKQVLPVWALATMVAAPPVLGLILVFLVGRERRVELPVAPPSERPREEPKVEEKPVEPLRPEEGPPPEAYVAALVSVLQREGRLLDFLHEDLDAYDDAQIGAAVRTIHRGLRNALLDLVELAPVIEAKEGAEVVVEEGFDPKEIRLVGKVRGKPPFRGILRHRGWRLVGFRLPKPKKDDVLAPAEVEIP